MDLNILYSLNEDPDAYWVLYDLCLLNGWALVDSCQVVSILGHDVSIPYTWGRYSNIRYGPGGGTCSLSSIGITYVSFSELRHRSTHRRRVSV